MAFKKFKGLKYTLAVLIILIISALALYQFGFLRQPNRNIPDAPTSFISPANGVISAIQTWSGDTAIIEKELRDAVLSFTGSVGDSGTIVSIMMHVYNVHYQRAPIQSTVISRIYTPGLFENATVKVNKYGVRFENENNELLLETHHGTRYKIIQVAGKLARRIEDYVEPGQQLQPGEIIGLIKLGSQVSLVFPHNVEVKVKEGDVVIDGETIIAEEIISLSDVPYN